ncbi:uncharacterized protein [Hetaerina americana]|uniref:uncharacterized protein n=1 Tax=Hetaerina americana TaxID=62018 RepID=UPI003A7F2175
MAAMLGYGREAVRVKVKKCEGHLQPEDRKFSVDPQITSFEVLLSILAKAFDIKGEFTVSYRVVDDYGQETYLSLLSDWDLDAAFLSASEPCLCLRVDMKKFEEGLALDDWEMSTPVSHEIHHHHHHHIPRMPVVATETKPQNRLPGLILNQVERTFTMVQRALNLVEEPNQSAMTPSPNPVYSTPCCSQTSLPPRPPLTDAEFRNFLGPLGQLTRGRELRAVVHLGGMEPSLRKVVWKHILNVYPDGMTGKERMDYMKKKSYEYEELRDYWKDMIKKGQMSEELAYVTSMVRKDVLRTDRHHKFYAGSDDNQNIASLFNVLTTYALNHPGVSYCQGMSDLASPLLVTMGDEAHAYITFVALMRRLRPNFTLDGLAMGAKFRHLGDGLAHTDPEFHAYLKAVQADDLLFCYRWLLLEMKREFAFEDALRMLEVLWSSLPPNPPQPSGLQLYEDVPYSARVNMPLDSISNNSKPSSKVDLPSKEPGTKVVCREVRTEGEGTAVGPTPKDKEKLPPALGTLPLSPIGVRIPLRETPYTRLCALRRRTSSGKGFSDRQNQSLDENLWARRRLQRAEDQARRPFFSLDESLAPAEADEMEVVGGEIQGGGENSREGRVRPAPIRRQHQVVKNLNEFLSLGRNRKEVGKRECEKRHSGDGAEEGAKQQNGKQQNGSPEAGSPSVDESSTEDDSAEYFPMTTSMTREIRLELESLDRQVFGEAKVRALDDEDEEEDEDEEASRDDPPSPGVNGGSSPRGEARGDPAGDSATADTRNGGGKREDGDGVDCFAEVTCKTQQLRRAERIERYDRVVGGGGGSGEEIFVWENPLQCPPTPDEQADLESDGGTPGGSDDSESGNQGSYNGEVIEVVEGGSGAGPGGGGVHVKSVTPIKLLRDHGNGPRARRTSSDSSDSSDGEILPEDSAEKRRPSAGGGASGVVVAGEGCLTTNSCEEVTEMTGLLVLGDSEGGCPQARVADGGDSRGPGVMDLPPPHEFGGGNPFLMFLCLTLLRQQRDHVMRAGMDANELAMHFDKMVRRHDVARVLNCARHMFAAYLRHHSAAASAASPCDVSDGSGVRSGGEGCSPTSHFAEGASELPT